MGVTESIDTSNATVMDINKIFIKIKGTFISALIDTGARISCIDLRLVKRLNLKIEQPSGNPSCLYSADGKQMEVFGLVQVDVRINGLRMPAEFQVLQDLTHQVILGIPFLQENQAIINLNQRTISFYNETISVPFRSNYLTNLYYVRIPKTVVLPAQTEAVISAIIDANYRLQTSIVEPVEGVIHKNILMAKSLVAPQKLNSRQICCRLVNPTNEAVILKGGTKLATIEPIDVDTQDVRTTIAGIESSNNFTNKESLRGGHKAPQPHTLKTAVDILQEIGITLDKSQMSQADHDELANFLVKNKDVFSTSLADLPGTHLVTHRIETGNALPIRRRIYAATPENKIEIEKQMEEMLAHGLVKESTSPWSSRVILVGKKDGSKRFCIDYRPLNQVTLDMYHPLITFSEVIQCMAEAQATTFSILDMRSGYMQIPLDEETADRCAFSTHLGHHQPTRLFFGLKNAPHSFTSLLQSVLQRIQYKFCLAYLDDVLVWSKGMKQQICHLEEVFSRFRKANLKLHPKKCNFGVRKVLYLGHYLSDKGLEPDQSKLQVMHSFPRPHNVKTVRSFLGLTQYYKKFVRGFAEIAHPLNCLLKKNAPFIWTLACEEAFVALKTALVTAPVLAFPDFSKDFVLVTDASSRSIGYVLEQSDSQGRRHPVGYGGRGLHGSESHFSVTDLECLAILCGVKEFHQYLIGKKFQIITDHCSLTYLNSLRLQSGRLLRWSIYLSQYNYEIIYRKGSQNAVADALSRREYEKETTETDIEDIIENDIFNVDDFDQGQTDSRRKHPRLLTEFDFGTSTNNSNTSPTEGEKLLVASAEYAATLVDIVDLEILQRKCPDFIDLFNYLEQSLLPSDDAKAKKVIFLADQYSVINGRLYHLYFPRAKGLSVAYPVVQQICVPTSLRKELLEAYHSNNLHIGPERLYTAIRQKYYWCGLYSDCYAFAKSCVICQEVKKSTSDKVAPLHPLELCDTFQRVHIDIMGPFTPSTDRKYRYLLICVDAMSRWAEMYPLVTMKAQEIVENLMDWISRFGAMSSILTDCAANLTSQIMKSLCAIFKIKHVTTSAHSQRTNSACEQLNRTVLQALRVHCPENQGNWTSCLKALLLSYRTTPGVNSTLYSPAEILYGKKLNHFIDVEYAARSDLPKDVEGFVAGMRPGLKIIQDAAKQNTLLSQERSKSIYDKRAKEPHFYVGQKVWRRNFKRRVGQNPKFYKKWEGPYFIVGLGDYPNSFKLRHVRTDAPVKFTTSGNDLKPFIDTPESDEEV